MSLIITNLDKYNEFSHIDIQFAKFIYTYSDSQNPWIYFTAALLNYLTLTEGCVCLNIKDYANTQFPLENTVEYPQITCPPLEAWQQLLADDNVIGDKNNTDKPLIFHNNNLYIKRYWLYEKKLIQDIQQRLQQTTVELDALTLSTRLNRLFPDTQLTLDLQRLAAETALTTHFSIISGGPGTGKTSTVVKILVLLLAFFPELRIALTAPTGKAAARLQASIMSALDKIDCGAKLKARIPTESFTIHRLLGARPKSNYFHSNSENLLPYDVVIMDEASMVDLPLISKLADAIPAHARWILLGDKDQLASVATGSVLGDLCRLHNDSKSDIDIPPNELQQSIVLLKKSYRFDESSGIGQLAKHVNKGNGHNALQTFQDETYADIDWHVLSEHPQLDKHLLNTLTAGFTPYLSLRDPQQILHAFDRFRVLCAVRGSVYGVRALNRLIEQTLHKAGLINANYRWYYGRPVMITRNDYGLKLYNGDVGIILWSHEGNQELYAYFIAQDGSVRWFWPNTLPEHETAYAMTIHKSQGSEFDHVVMVLPEQPSAVTTRELVYTGITRAKSKLDLWANEFVFKEALQQQVKRASGLSEGFLESD